MEKSQEQAGATTAAAEEPSFFSPFGFAIFRWLWLAILISNIGTWMYNASAGWLMTILSGGPLMVSLVQVAISAPMFLLALPAGALADIVDKRWFIIVLEALFTLTCAVFAALIWVDWVTPAIVLLFVFLIGVLTALEAPSYQAIVPMLVPKHYLPHAIELNSLGINISRAIGPALAGAIIVVAGIAAPFWINAISNLGVIGVMLWWRQQKKPARPLPAEHLTSAMRTGVRYVRFNRHIRATLLRNASFVFFASAYWALLPVLTKTQIKAGPEIYGLLLGTIGIGAVAGALVMPALQKKLGTNRLVAAAQGGTAIALVMYGIADDPLMALAASALAGLCWISGIANLNVSAQISLPDWVRGRGLAVYVAVFYGSMTLASFVWGGLGEIVELRNVFFVAAACALVAIPLTARWQLQTAAGINFTPSLHWPEPVFSAHMSKDAGPVMVTVEYRTSREFREEFLSEVAVLEGERRRDGAYAWGIYQDTTDECRFVEVFFVGSWLEHLRQHHRVTNADRENELRIRQRLSEPATVSHYIAAGSESN